MRKLGQHLGALVELDSDSRAVVGQVCDEVVDVDVDVGVVGRGSGCRVYRRAGVGSGHRWCR